MAKRVRATIIYATETGKSETFAKQLAKLVHFSFFVNVKFMEDYDFDGIEKESLLLVVTSTFGNGEAPDNGKASPSHTLEFLQLRLYFQKCLNAKIFKIELDIDSYRFKCERAIRKKGLQFSKCLNLIENWDQRFSFFQKGSNPSAIYFYKDLNSV